MQLLTIEVHGKQFPIVLCLHSVCELTAISSVHIALTVNGHLSVNLVDHGRATRSPLCKGQIDSKNERIPRINDRLGR